MTITVIRVRARFSDGERIEVVNLLDFLGARPHHVAGHHVRFRSEADIGGTSVVHKNLIHLLLKLRLNFPLPLIPVNRPHIACLSGSDTFASYASGCLARTFASCMGGSAKSEAEHGDVLTLSFDCLGARQTWFPGLVARSNTNFPNDECA